MFSADPTDLVALDALLAGFGIQLPDDARRVVELHRSALEAAETPAVSDLARDIVAGTIDPADVRARVLEAATALGARDYARTILNDVLPACNKLATRWYRENGDWVIEQIRPAWDDAAAKLTDAVDKLGGATDPAAVLAAGPAAAKAWNAREAAVEVLRQARKVRKHLARAGYGRDPYEGVDWYLDEAPTTDELDYARGCLKGNAFDVVALIAGGHKLRLNTGAEAVALLDTAEAGSKAARLAALANDPRVQAYNRRVETEARMLREAVTRDVARA